MADDTTPTVTNAEAFARAEYEFDTARLQLLRTEVEGRTAEENLTVQAADLNSATLEATIHVVQHGGTEVPAANEGEHQVVEAVFDADRELETRMDDIKQDAQDLEARYNELRAKPPEERDHEEMLDLAHQMTDLATRAHESNTDFGARADEITPRIVEVAADVAAHDPGEVHVVVAEPSHASDGSAPDTAHHDATDAHAHADSTHATDSSGFDGSANAGE